MSAGITPEFLEELKFKCDIAEVISQYVPLTKKGGRYFGCCPFHNEKTPSFCVTQSAGYYHCFGCGASGDVVKFIMEIESLPFYEAVKFLADKAGMVMPEFKLDPEYNKKKERTDILKQAMRDAARYYRNNLTNEIKGKAAREYLLSRGISDEVAAVYGLGLSMDYDSMQAYMRRKGYTGRDLRECGLANGENLTDAFANRIIVPIFNSMNEVVAFGGRVYHGEKDTAKYKNSTNTPIFDKGRTVYGVNFIKKLKKEGAVFKELILVEGYMDVISLGAAGIRNAVAGMGTALTDGQATEIKRIADTVNVCYDGDAAGRKAAVKNVEPLIKVGLDLKIISLPEGNDPDEIVRKDGYAGFMKYVSEALPVIDYKLKLCKDAFDTGSVNGRAKYVNAALNVLKDIESYSAREVYIAAVSKISGVSVDTLSAECDALNRVGAKAGSKSKAIFNGDNSDGKTKEADSSTVVPELDGKNLRAARYVLNKLLNNSYFADTSHIKSEWFKNEEHEQIFSFVLNNAGNVVIGNIFGVLPTNNEINKVLDVNLLFDDPKDGKTAPRAEAYYRDCVLVLANDFLDGMNAELLERYKAESSSETKREILIKIQDCQKKRASTDIEDKL